MIAKLVPRGAPRDAATDRMRGALDGFDIRGVSHNIGFLAALLAKPRFRAGAISTDFIAEEFPEGFTGADLAEAERSAMVVVAAVVRRRMAEREGAISGQLPGHGATLPTDWVVCIGTERHAVSVTPQGDGY